MTESTVQKKPGPSRPRRQRVQSVATGMVILKGLAQLGGRASLAVLSRHIAENPAKVHRYVASLMEEGLISQDAASAHYLLGAESIRIGLAAMRLADPIRAAESELIHLREKLEMTCFIAVMGNKGPTIVRFEEPGLPVTLNVRVGSVLPLLWSATGRVCLGFLDGSRVLEMAKEELRAAAPERRAILDKHDPIGGIQREVRRLGMGIVKDTNLQGISAIAVPIFDFTEHARAVLTVLGTTGSFDASADGAVARLMRQVSETISSTLGYSKA